MRIGIRSPGNAPCVREGARLESRDTDLSEALFVDRGQSGEQVKRDADRYRPFVVSPSVAELDAWLVVLVEADEAERLLWHREGEAEGPRECTLGLGEFERVSNDFLAALRASKRFE